MYVFNVRNVDLSSKNVNVSSPSLTRNISSESIHCVVMREKDVCKFGFTVKTVDNQFEATYYG